MNILLRSHLARVCGIVLVSALCSSCVTPDEDHVAASGFISYGIDFYEPFYYDYGFWGPRYRIAPPRPGERRPGRRPNVPPPHTYRPAPPSHPMPSIPTRPHFERPPPQNPRSRPH